MPGNNQFRNNQGAYLASYETEPLDPNGLTVLPVHVQRVALDPTASAALGPAAVSISGTVPVSGAVNATIVGTLPAFAATPAVIIDNTASGGIIKPNWKGDKAFNSVITGAGNATLIPAQGAGNGWFLDTIVVSISASAAMAAAGINDIRIFDTAAGATIFELSPWLPAASITTSVGGIIYFQAFGIGYNAKGANNTLVAAVTTALTAGAININGTWGTTTIIT